MKRLLSDEFKNDLLGGILTPLLEHILNDNTLMLAIRENSINVYYRGGNILKLGKIKNKREYRAFFDKKYAAGTTFLLPRSPELIVSDTQIQEWISGFPDRKQIMDYWFTKNPKMEREFQQLVVRENNYSSISNATEYFIADIELTESNIGARFDLLAFKWPSAERKTDEVQLALIEMKYGDSALKGRSGIVAHLKHLNKFLQSSENRKKLCDMAAGQINQLNELGLILHTKKEGRNFAVGQDRFEVIFLFANHNPRSPILLSELESPEFSSIAVETSKFCDIRFFIASSAGYGMHEACMTDRDGYCNFLRNLR